MATIAENAIKNAARTMKARAKQEEKPTRVGNPIVLSAWLEDYLKLPAAEEGKPAPEMSATQKHLSEATKTEVKNEAGDRVTALETEHLVCEIDVAKLKLDEKPYDMEFVRLTAKTATGRLILCNGVDDITYEGEGDNRSEVPSVTKYFNTAFSQNARNAAAARVRTIVEGPEKALASAAKKLATAWGVSEEEAARRIKAMQEMK